MQPDSSSEGGTRNPVSGPESRYGADVASSAAPQNSARDRVVDSAAGRYTHRTPVFGLSRQEPADLSCLSRTSPLDTRSCPLYGRGPRPSVLGLDAGRAATHRKLDASINIRRRHAVESLSRAISKLTRRCLRRTLMRASVNCSKRVVESRPTGLVGALAGQAANNWLKCHCGRKKMGQL
jgi:hypothetical protein